MILLIFLYGSEANAVNTRPRYADRLKTFLITISTYQDAYNTCPSDQRLKTKHSCLTQTALTQSN